MLLHDNLDLLVVARGYIELLLKVPAFMACEEQIGSGRENMRRQGAGALFHDIPLRR